MYLCVVGFFVCMYLCVVGRLFGVCVKRAINKR